MKKVLAIEDEQNIRETLADLLEILGYQVVQAGDGEQGIKLARNEKPDLILCDINMPGKDGYEVLEILNGDGQLTFVPFIFLTAKSTMEELRRGMEMGADDYLTKPFTHDSLIKTISACEKKKLAQMEQFNVLQNKLNAEKLKLKDIGWLNSHELRRRTSLLQGIYPVIKSGQMTLEEGLELLEESGKEMESATEKVNQIVNGNREENFNGKPCEIEIESIWLVDDDSTQNMLNKFVLKQVNPNWTITEFSNPQKALESLKSGKPDLIFLDINMPEISGFQFLDEIKKANIAMEVIMLSSSVSPSDIKQSLSFDNVVSYVTKPLKRESIEELLVKK